jgi:hypothetical protein
MCCFNIGTTITCGVSRRGGDPPAMNHARCQQARWRLPCIATKASTVLTQLYSCINTIAHTVVQLPCIPSSCHALALQRSKGIIMPYLANIMPCCCHALALQRSKGMIYCNSADQIVLDLGLRRRFTVGSRSVTAPHRSRGTEASIDPLRRSRC